MIHFESPWAFLLLLLMPLFFWIRRLMSGKSAVRFSSVRNAEKVGRSLRQKLAPMSLILRILTVICLITAIARPQTGREEIRDISQGVAIEIIVDRSGSMAAEMAFKGKNMTRLEVVKQVLTDFVLGDDSDLSGRPNDLVGMVSFARYPNTICPLTLAHGALPQFLKSVKLVQDRNEDGTNIGDALALAAARLKTADETLAKQNQEGERTYEIKSKVAIVLSDGENNFGKRNPVQAAELAKKWGIRVYTIAIGSGEGVQSIRTPFGVYKVPVGHKVDTSALRDVADITGGFFREANDAKSLYDIYSEIDKMEKSEIESVRFVDYRESFLPLALAAIVLMVIATVLDNTLFRKIP